jgi:hypothetical protein
MRILALAGVLVLLVPSAAAEWGAYGPDGWPLDVDGNSTNPAADPLNQAAGVTLYPYWPLLKLEVERLARDHPDLVRLHSAGKSTLGLDLFMLEICNFKAVKPVGDDACPTPDGARRETVWVDGGTHSNEYSGVYFALAWAQFLADGYASNETARWIVDNRHTWILPMVNPDGSNAMGRLNARAVNINRNYPVAWGAIAETPVLNNPGPAPASEVETQVNIEWFQKVRPDYYASVHCCGNLWLYPYGVEGMDPVDNAMLARVCDEAFAAVRTSCGPIWSTIYPASGSSIDTVYEMAGSVAFGYEMSGRGAVLLWGQPLTHESVREQERESWDGLLHAFLNVERYGAHLVLERLDVEGEAIVVTLRNDGYGNLTGGTARFAGAEAPLPPMAAGATAQVRLVPDQDEAGASYDLALEYPKRLGNATRVAQQALPLGSWLAHSGGLEAASQATPAVGVLAFAAAALAAVALRRRA